MLPGKNPWIANFINKYMIVFFFIYFPMKAKTWEHCENSLLVRINESIICGKSIYFKKIQQSFTLINVITLWRIVSNNDWVKMKLFWNFIIIIIYQLSFELTTVAVFDCLSERLLLTVIISHSHDVVGNDCCVLKNKAKHKQTWCSGWEKKK